MKALIIDNEVDICYLLANLLRKKNLNASYVNSLADAATALKDIHDIIFLDNHLPDGLGMNFISYIKEHSPTSKIIMITAHDTALERNNALNNGVDYFISKPFSRDTIYQTVEKLIN